MFKAASEMEQSGAQWISEGMKAFMFESSVRELLPFVSINSKSTELLVTVQRQLTLTEWAVNGSNTIHYHEVRLWLPLISLSGLCAYP